MTKIAKDAMFWLVAICIGGLGVFCVTDMIVSERGAVPSVNCRQAPNVALTLDSVTVAGKESDLWACGVRLGDGRHMPALRCYRMSDACEDK